MGKSNQVLSTTDTSLRVIEFLREQGGTTAEDLAAELGLAESTLYKHLATLSHRGFVVEDAGEYFLGTRFYDLGMHVRNSHKLFELAGKQVVELAGRADEESDFGVEENGRIVTLYDSIGSRREPSNRRNNYEYMHTTAIGKAILAEQPRAQLEETIDRWGLPQVTQNSITSREELIAELEMVRERGYAINDQESIPGKRVTGMAVKHPSGYVIGGLTLSGPEYRIEDVHLHEEFPDILRSVIQEFTSELKSQNISISRGG